jgi:hypothetical protein
LINAGSLWHLPQSWGIFLRDGLPIKPAARLFAASGSSATLALGLPP